MERRRFPARTSDSQRAVKSDLGAKGEATASACERESGGETRRRGPHVPGETVPLQVSCLVLHVKQGIFKENFKWPKLTQEVLENGARTMIAGETEKWSNVCP